MSIYSVEIRDQFGRFVGNIKRPQSKKFTLARNRPGSCLFTLDLYDPQATSTFLQPNIYDVVFRRNGTPVFAGQLAYLNPMIQGDKKTVECIATGYFDLFDYRLITSDFPGYDAVHTKLPFTNVDLSTIAWNLISYSQFPITSDGTQSSNGTQTLSQQFVAQTSSPLKTIQLLLQNNSISGGNVVVGIYADLFGYPNGTLVPGSQVTILSASVGSSFGWTVFDYSSLNINLTQGATYWITASLDTVQTGGNGLGWSYVNGNLYPSGKAYSYQTPALFSAGQNLMFSLLHKDNLYIQTKYTNFGINQGTLNTSVNLSPTFDQYKKIKGAIEDLTNTYNGIDIAFSVVIDPVTNIMTKYFNAYYPKIGIDNTNLTFAYPGNIKEFKKPKDGKTVLNEVYVRGNGSGVNQNVQICRDANSIQTYFLRQEVQHEADVTDSSVLTSLGNETIRVKKVPMEIPEIVIDGKSNPQFGSYGIGDLIRVQINSPAPVLLKGTNQYRIEQIDVTITDDDQEIITLALSIA